MALTFDRSLSENITSVDTAIPWGIGTGNCTICAFVWPTSFPATFQAVTSFGDNTNLQPAIFTSSTTTPNSWRISFDGTKVFNAVLTTTGWQHLAVRRTSTAAGGVQGFYNGAIEASTHQSTVSFLEASWTIGSGRPNGQLGLTGRVAEVAAWNTDLTDGEIAQLAMGLSPRFIRPGNLTGYAECVNSEFRDQAQGVVFSPTGGFSGGISEHPRITYPRPRAFSFLWPSGELTGTGAGVSTASATLLGGGTLTAATAGISTASALLLGTGAITAATAGVATASALLSGTGQVLASAAGASTASSTLLGDGLLAASAAGLSTANASLLGDGQLTGAAAGTSTGTASLPSDTSLTGIAAGSSTASSTLLGTGQLLASAAGASTASASLLGSGVLTASTAGASTASASLLGSGVLTASAGGASTAAATLVGNATLTAAAAGISTASASLLGTGTLTAAAAGASTASSSLFGSDTLTGTAAGTSSASSPLFGTGQLTAASAGLASGNALLLGPDSLTGTSAGGSTSNAILLSTGQILATCAGIATGNAILTGSGTLLGSSSGQSTAAAGLFSTGTLSGSSAGTSFVAALLLGATPSMGFEDEFLLIEILTPEPSTQTTPLAGLSQRLRIQNRLIAEATAGPFYAVRTDPNTKQITVRIGQGSEITPNRIYAEEVASEAGVASRNRTEYRLDRLSWTWELVVEFNEAATAELFERRLLAKPPFLPANKQYDLEWVCLMWQSSGYEHPPQQQPSSGTRVTLTFDAVLGPS